MEDALTNKKFNNKVPRVTRKKTGYPFSLLSGRTAPLSGRASGMQCFEQIIVAILHPEGLPRSVYRQSLYSLRSNNWCML